jgi:hypothetical protein
LICVALCTKTESIQLANKLSKNRQWGWEIFKSIEKYCKTEYGYGAFPDVRDNTRTPNDSMESFFLGETMKYLYLLFDPDTEIDLEKVSSTMFWIMPHLAINPYLISTWKPIVSQHVFNTEAHPLPTGIFTL